LWAKNVNAAYAHMGSISLWISEKEFVQTLKVNVIPADCRILPPKTTL
jgi:hypothetical protein